MKFLDQEQLFHSCLSMSLKPSELIIKSVKSREDSWEVCKLRANFSKQNLVLQVQCKTEQASVKMVSFPCGGHILSLAQKGRRNLSDWLTLFS